MIEEVLGILKQELDGLNINSEYMEYTKSPTYPYWTFEYFENENSYENGLKDISIILEGFARKSYLLLEKDKMKICTRFDGLRKNNILFTYENGGPIRTGDIELKKVQINLNARAWKENRNGFNKE